MSTTASYGRSRSGDRFYNPPAIRRQLQSQQQQPQQQQLLVQKHNQQQVEREKEEIRREKQQHYYHHHYQNQHHQHQNQNQQQNRRPKPAVKVKSLTSAADSSENRPESDDCASTTATTTPADSMSSPSTLAVSNLTNLDRFLGYTTPLVPAQYFSKTSMKGWRTQEDGYRPYFVLGDLWESFKEWSAYGAGVPLLLNGSDSVVQYYVPYLSGIQLYINSSKPSSIIRKSGDESDESSSETSSAGSSDCETERRASCSGVWRQQHLVESALQGMNGLSVRNNAFNGSSSDEGEYTSSAGALIFEYFEHEPPFNREPLADKISLLASRFSELKTYRSCDLSPSSWISVAWYPIYRIPTGPTLQNLDSCFLTFHSLATPVLGALSECQYQYGSCRREVPNGFDHRALKLSLPVFGMASYKFRISIWDHNGVDESPRASALLRAADEWLRLLNVNHPDYRFFVSHNYNWR